MNVQEIIANILRSLSNHLQILSRKLCTSNLMTEGKVVALGADGLTFSFFMFISSAYALDISIWYFTVVDSCRIFLTKWSDTFRCFFFEYGNKQESRKNMS